MRHRNKAPLDAASSKMRAHGVLRHCTLTGDNVDACRLSCFRRKSFSESCIGIIRARSLISRGLSAADQMDAHLPAGAWTHSATGWQSTKPIWRAQWRAAERINTRRAAAQVPKNSVGLIHTRIRTHVCLRSNIWILRPARNCGAESFILSLPYYRFSLGAVLENVEGLDGSIVSRLMMI